MKQIYVDVLLIAEPHATVKLKLLIIISPSSFCASFEGLRLVRVGKNVYACI